MIVPSFTAKGGITSVVSGYRGSELEKQYQVRYIETYCDGGKAKKLWKAICSYAFFLWTLLIFRPDLIHIHSSFGASFYRKAPFIYIGSALRIPVVNHIHGSELAGFFSGAADAKKKTVLTAYGKCSRLIVLSEEWKHRFSEFWGSEKLVVIPNYATVPPTDNASSPAEQNDVLFLGFLSEKKGCFDIPKVAALVRQSTPSVKFILAGSGEKQNVQHISSLAEEYGLENALTFPGWVRGEEKEALFRRAAVFFLPSYTEGMPMSILEAMAHGLPVVSTTVGGIPELVRHGESGFLLEPGDTEGFAEAIVTILNDPHIQREMGQTGLAFVREHYSLEKHIHSLVSIYNSLIG